MQIAVICAVVLTTTALAFCWAALHLLITVSEVLPVALYMGVTAVVLLPLPVLHRPTRRFFATTATRVLVPLQVTPHCLPANSVAACMPHATPVRVSMCALWSRALLWRACLLRLQEVTWADFLLADIFCSLSKSTSDFAAAMCHMASGARPQPSMPSGQQPAGLLLAPSPHACVSPYILHAGPVLRSLAVPTYQRPAWCSPIAPPMLTALCLPYIIRFVQCLRVHRTTGNKAQVGLEMLC